MSIDSNGQRIIRTAVSDHSVKCVCREYCKADMRGHPYP